MRLLVALLLLSVALPAVADDGPRLYVTAGGKVARLAPGGDPEPLFDDRYAGDDAAASPDGTRVAYRKWDWFTEKTTVGVRGKDGERVPLLSTEDSVGRVVWSADGKTLFCSVHPVDMPAEAWQCWAVDAASGKQTAFAVPAGAELIGLTAAGEELVFVVPGGGGEKGYATVTTAAGKFEPTEVMAAGLQVVPLAPFPDGKRWLGRAAGMPGTGVYTAGDKGAAAWEDNAHAGYAGAVRPDGKRVAYAIAVVTRGGTGPTHELWTADPDGSNPAKVLESAKPIDRVEWR